MSTVLIITPVIIAGWPAITAAAAGAALALGLTAQKTGQEQAQASACEEQLNQAQVELADSEVMGETMAKENELVLTRENVTLRVKRDSFGRCSVCAEGKGRTKAQLKKIAEEFAQKMTQCFVYNRVMTELKGKGFNVVNEEKMKDETLRIHVRRFEE